MSIFNRESDQTGIEGGTKLTGKSSEEMLQYLIAQNPDMADILHRKGGLLKRLLSHTPDSWNDHCDGFGKLTSE